MTTGRSGSPPRLLAVVAALAAALAPACRGRREPAPPPPPLEPLVVPTTLREHLRQPDPPLVIDTRREGDYGVGHVPGSVNLPLEEFGHLPDTGIDPATRARVHDLLGTAGVRPGLPVVAVDEGSPRGFGRAASLCWILSLVGHGECVVLEGGVTAWGAARGRLVTPRFVPVRPGAPDRMPARPPSLATLDALRRATADGEVAIVDVRPPGSPGGIPGSLALPLAPIVLQDGRIDRKVLLEEAEAAGILAETEILVLGNDLSEGAGAWFLLERVLGLRHVRLYPGGFDRYLSWPQLPGAGKHPPAARGNLDGRAFHP